MVLLDYGGLQLKGRPLLAHSNSQEGKKGKKEAEQLMGIKSEEEGVARGQSEPHKESKVRAGLLNL